MGELLPAKLRSVGVGLVAAGEVISALCQTVAAAPMEDALGQSGLFVVFAGVVLATSVYGVRKFYDCYDGGGTDINICRDICFSWYYMCNILCSTMTQYVVNATASYPLVHLHAGDVRPHP